MKDKCQLSVLSEYTLIKKKDKKFIFKNKRDNNFCKHTINLKVVDLEVKNFRFFYY